MLAIYQLDESDGRHPNATELRGKNPIYETKEADSIFAVLSAAAARADERDECLRDPTGPEYFVAAYDSSQYRVGSFRSRLCETSDGRFATVRPTGGAGIYTSRDLADVLGGLPVLP